MEWYIIIGGVLHAGTECVEHIQIIITSAQKVDNKQTIWVGVI